jgi:hypothetical protein
MRHRALAGAWAALALAAAGCGAAARALPQDAVQSYITALGNGNYAQACAMLQPSARRRLIRLAGARVSCPRAFARCLPDRVTRLRHDQTQLLFADVQATTRGRTAVARVSGTAVATAVREVTLRRRRGRWHLTSYGSGLRRCPGGRSHARGRAQ